MTFFNRIFETGRCVIVPAFKKGYPMLIGSFHPICLLSGLSKAFARLLNQKVSVAAEKMGIFNNTQGGGRRMRDIWEKLSIIKGVIDHVNKNDKQLYFLLTDISKTFDSVPHNAVTAAYRYFNFLEGTIVRNMLKSTVVTHTGRFISTEARPASLISCPFPPCCCCMNSAAFAGIAHAELMQQALLKRNFVTKPVKYGTNEAALQLGCTVIVTFLSTPCSCHQSRNGFVHNSIIDI